MILGFKTAFVPLIQAGSKVHTIREGYRWRAGLSIQFYQNVCQRNMAKFRPDGVVTSTQAVGIYHGGRLFVDGRQLKGEELELFARRDGFDNSEKLFAFFSGCHKKPFRGQLVHWTDLTY